MLVKNQTRSAVIAQDAKFCEGILSKFIGLMFSTKPKVLVFKFKKEMKISLHMLFVFFSIDVLFLDKNKTVVDEKENFRPFTFYKSKEKAMYAVELTDGVIKKTKTGIGVKIEF